MSKKEDGQPANPDAGQPGESPDSPAPEKIESPILTSRPNPKDAPKVRKPMPKETQNEDELALQDDSAPVKPQAWKPRKPVKPSWGATKPKEVGDTTRFLVYGAIVLGVLILVPVYLLFSSTSISTPPPKPQFQGSVPDGENGAYEIKKGSTTKKPSGHVQHSSQKDTPKMPLGNEDTWKGNLTNKICFHSYLRFMTEALQSSEAGQVLAERFSREVSPAGVDDPKLAELIAQAGSLLRLLGPRSLEDTLRIQEIQIAQGHRHGVVTEKEENKKIHQIMVQMGSLRNLLESRYGNIP